MAHEVVGLAPADADLAREDLQVAYFLNTFRGMYTNQHSIRGQVALRSMGIGGDPGGECGECVCRGCTALHLPVNGIRVGVYDVALAAGSTSRITHGNKAVALRAYTSSMDVENIQPGIDLIMKLNEDLSMDTGEQDAKPARVAASSWMLTPWAPSGT